MVSLHEFLYPKLVLFVLGFWSSVLSPLFRCLTRFTKNGSSWKGKSENSQVVLSGVNEESFKVAEQNTELEENQDFFESLSAEKDGIDEKEEPEFSFTFKFPTFEEFSKSNKEFLEKPSLVPDKELHEYIDNDFEVGAGSDCGVLTENDQKQDDFEVGAVSDCGVLTENDQKQDDFEEEEEEEIDHEEIVYNPNEKMISEVVEADRVDTFVEEKLEKLHHESVSSYVDSDTDSMSSTTSQSAMSHQVDDGFLSDGDFERKFDEKEEGDWEKPNFLSEKDFGGNPRNTEESVDKNVESNEDNSTNKLESLWEHQELIEQLKMEIKKVKATGLPTIFEESEAPPKFMQELKPWQIEDVYQSGGNKMVEVHKLYKSYRDRMRKLDIFNYQKMYAIGFLQSKDPLQEASSSKSSLPEITTLLCQSFSRTKGKKRENDPTTNFIKELQADLEVVYVGQMCLSWEILHWQYEKALDLWESDPRGVRRFNEVAGEFQQFQVLMQRFIEDEPFQGPRVQNYAKSRCVFRNLLQVPVIREDGSKARKKSRSEGDVYDITSDTLVEILEESIRIFWHFVRADKGKRQAQVEFQKPEDSQIFMEANKDLQKKERKLKEQLRGGNCILRKLRKCREEEGTEDQVLYFFSQVDMKLVGRVLNMGRLTSDRIVWCQSKLSKVSFVNSRIHVEPSFLLFPC